MNTLLTVLGVVLAIMAAIVTVKEFYALCKEAYEWLNNR